jgi:hypothetical protein
MLESFKCALSPTGGLPQYFTKGMITWGRFLLVKLKDWRLQG